MFSETVQQMITDYYTAQGAEYAEKYYPYMIRMYSEMPDWETFVQWGEYHLKRIISIVYFKIVDAYDKGYRTALPEEWWVPFMKYNIINLLHFTRKGSKTFDANAVLEKLASKNWHACIYPHIILRANEEDDDYVYFDDETLYRYQQLLPVKTKIGICL